ncbi:MoxR family ATPase [Proteinivorax hydrogeniformans]|uniref:MoxR family ATPase n=1 Tax=Proteinivorax hydrogeniformans TaxID=1826727 RepID=A0AAU8HTL7_9FIRM
MEGIKGKCNQIKENVSKVIVGKEEVIDQLLVSIITSGHVLLEDVPGLGKTLLTKAFAKSIDCDFSRIQFTPDLLPSDVTGINFYNQKQSQFEFKQGPIFNNIVLADEINRATPRTQSSLLESMEEVQVSVDGETYKLDSPFMIIATENPVEQQGTFPLPEAQMDRFLMKISMGYPNFEEEMEILNRFRKENPIDSLETVLAKEDILKMQKKYTDVYISEDIKKYIVKIVQHTRNHKQISLGASPRGSLALFKAVQAFAVINGRDYVLPDDVQKMVEPILGHRIVTAGLNKLKGEDSLSVIKNILKEVKAPVEEQVVSR